MFSGTCYHKKHGITEVTEVFGGKGSEGSVILYNLLENEHHLTPSLHKIECYQEGFLLLKKKVAIRHSIER